MTAPTTPRPAPEAVDAAMIEGKADQRLSDAECERVFLHKGYWALPVEKKIAAARILSAEVEWLRYKSNKEHLNT